MKEQPRSNTILELLQSEKLPTSEMTSSEQRKSERESESESVYTPAINKHAGGQEMTNQKTALFHRSQNTFGPNKNVRLNHRQTKS